MWKSKNKRPISLCAGRVPWEPSVEATDLNVILTYDFPRVGTYADSDKSTRVLFRCLDSDDDTSVWVYVRVSKDEAASADSGSDWASTDAMWDELDGLIEDGRRRELALAVDLELVHHTTIADEEPTESAVGQLFRESLKQLELRLDAGEPSAAVQPAINRVEQVLESIDA